MGLCVGFCVRLGMRFDMRFGMRLRLGCCVEEAAVADRHVPVKPCLAACSAHRCLRSNRQKVRRSTYCLPGSWHGRTQLMRGLFWHRVGMFGEAATARGMCAWHGPTDVSCSKELRGGDDGFNA